MVTHIYFPIKRQAKIPEFHLVPLILRFSGSMPPMSLLQALLTVARLGGTTFVRALVSIQVHNFVQNYAFVFQLRIFLCVLA